VRVVRNGIGMPIDAEVEKFLEESSLAEST